MTPSPITVHVLTGAEATAAVPELAQLLMDVVDAGAGVSFMAPLQRTKAEAFWQDIAQSVTTGEILLLAALDAGQIAGTVQLQPVWKDNQPHRADVAKLLVPPQRRRGGIATKLMLALEHEAKALHRSLLVLDTETGGAGEALYKKMGWRECGVIPGFALRAHGGLCSTTMMYRELAD